MRKPSAPRSKACASAFRRNTGCRAWRPEIETLWQRGAQWLRGCRRRDGRDFVAAHEICAAGLLHRRAGGGVFQSRALRRRALRAARARPRHRRNVRTHARGRFRQGSAPAHHDRHLCAVRRLLRRLLSAGAKGAHPDQARFRGVLRRGRRRHPDADDAFGRVRASAKRRAPIRSKCTSTTFSP